MSGMHGQKKVCGRCSWLPLTLRQIPNQSRVDGYSQLVIQRILITVDVLDFLGYEGLVINKQKKFKELLERAEISFKQIAHIFSLEPLFIICGFVN